MASTTIKRSIRTTVIAATLAASAVIPTMQATAAPVTIDGVGTFEVPDAFVIPTNFTIPTPEQVAAPFSSAGQAVVDAAMSKIGSPYVWGATGPSAFDCSGLTTWAHQQVGITVPRTSQGQAGGGISVSIDQLQPGDIVVMYSGASHVGIYIGNGQIVHALNSGLPVQVDSLSSFPFHSAHRYV